MGPPPPYFMNPIKLLISLLALFNFVWALTPAGTLIRNQASASFQGETYLSNEVGTRVKALCVPQLGPNGTVLKPGQQATGRPGHVIYFPYVLQNAGNASFDFRLGWAQDVGSSWTPETLRIIADANGNGQIDDGEVALRSLNLARNKTQALVVEITIPQDALGTSYITPTVQCATGELDDQNFALIRVTQGPALQVFKTASKPSLSQGENLDFRLRIINNGASSTDAEVVLSDMLDTPELAGLAFVPGSAEASGGRLEYFDGDMWQLAEPETVKGLRLVIAELAPGEELSLNYRVQVLTSAEPGIRRNVALAEGPGGPADASTEFEISSYYEHHLGPIDNPRALPGGEESQDDRQSLNRLIFGQSSCFNHSLLNAGNAQDSYTLRLSGLPAGVSASFNTLQDAPLAEVIELQAGESIDFQLCLTTAGTEGGFGLTLAALSQTTDEVNLTFDDVEASVSASQISLVKTAGIEGAVDAGQELSYTLSISNGNGFDLHNLVVTDQLQTFVAQSGKTPEIRTEFVSATQGGRFDAESRVVTWTFAELKSGESLELGLTIRLPDTPPTGEVFSLANYFVLEATELINPLKSNTVFHGFPVINIDIAKSVNPQTIHVGETLTYNITVSNPNNVPIVIELSDKPDGRLAYVKGSSVFTLGQTEFRLEPSQTEEKLVWDLRTDKSFSLQAAGDPDGRDKLSVSYQMVPKPGASGKLRNTAQVFGQYDFLTGEDSVSNPVTGVSVTSLEVEAEVEVVASFLTEPNALLSGRVFFDFNNDGLYDQGFDQALPGARIVLSNGWQTLSDNEGRYSFRDLQPGPWSVMLDPVSAPFALKEHAEALGQGFRHRVILQGLTVSDFVLEPPLGKIGVSRESTLIYGPLRIDKQLLELGDSVRVVLHLSSSEALPELSIEDEVPGQSAKRFYFELFEGETTLTYDLPSGSPLTDPQARWRYP